MDIIKPGRVIDFMGMRRFWLIFSIALTTLCVVLLIKPGPKYGIDFLGGTEVTVRFNRPVDAAAVRRSLTGMHHDGAEIVPSQNVPNQYIIRVERTSTVSPARIETMRAAVRTALGDVALREFQVSPGGDHIVIELGGAKTAAEVATMVREAGANVRGDAAIQVGDVAEHRWQVPLVSVGDEIFAGLTRDTSTEGQLQASVWVSPKAGKELRDQAIRAVLYSIVFIMIYVAFRFDLRFAPGGILGMFHDALVVLGFFAATRREVTISTVAAVLTVIGYSMNDTVIIYDRIRENLAKRRGVKLVDIINESVSETFSRTIVTSTTVILSMIPFSVYGSGAIRDFALAMIVGVLAGTYSSIYVAAPLTEWIDARFFHNEGMMAPAAPVVIDENGPVPEGEVPGSNKEAEDEPA